MNEQRKPLLHHLHDYFLPHERNNHRPHIFSFVSVAVLAIAIVVFEAGYLVQTKVVFLNTNFLASVLPGVLATLTNESRAEGGLTPVTRDAQLDAVAQTVAEDMAAKGYFSHVSPDGKTPWYWLNQAGYSYSYAGQNLAVNFTDSENVQTAWLESPTHRANIMKREYTRVGFGTANGLYEGKETTFVVEFFATPSVASTEQSAPVPVALATPAEVRLPQEQVATAPAKVLGSEIANIAVAPAVVPTAVAPLASPSWITRALASPLNTLMSVFAILFGLIAAFFTRAVLVRGKFQHQSVIIGGLFLLVLISSALFLTALSAGPILLPPASQTAGIGAALLN